MVNSMKKRVISAIIALIIVIPVILIGGYAYYIGVGIISVIGFHELLKKFVPFERKYYKERFYKFLSFYSYDDLKYQMKNYLKRSNNTPMQTLEWLTPLEMRQKIKTIFNN